MSHVEAIVYCPNLSCQTGNPEANQFCQSCGTLLPKRYLWAVGEEARLLTIGQLYNDRYLVKASQILLDTKPGYLPDFPEEPDNQTLSYLRLFTYRPHLPEAYGVLPQKSGKPILLLERFPLDKTSIDVEMALLPALQTAWAEASSLRQLHWLWQIARLWQPCRGEGVATSLLTPSLLRVEGSLVRLLALESDGSSLPNLMQLGQSWQSLVTAIQPVIYDFVDRLCQALIQGQIHTSDHLVAYLDAGLRYLGQYQTYQIEVATLSDRGPSRKRNEDACHPPSGTSFSKTWCEANSSQFSKGVTANPPNMNRSITDAAWTIVCDGIGGHQGGDIASNSTVSTLQEQLENLVLKTETLDSEALTTYLENAVYLANDRISQRNDQDQKTDFQRMGTTLLTLFAQAHELYLTHVGDSRAYRISSTGCYQMMADDDVASREVRLGYAFYRQATQHHASGVLVQAIGTNSSNLLHPTVQRFILDEDCVWLLCSDGLSDNDLVDACWQSELLPLLTGNTNLTTAVERLVMIANYQNGHDNVTVALLQVRSQPTHTIDPLPSTLVEFCLSPQFAQQFVAIPTSNQAPISHLKTQLAPTPRSRSQSWLLLLVTFSLLTGAAYFLAPILRNWIISQQPPPLGLPTTLAPSTPSPTIDPALSPTPPISPVTIEIGTIVKTTKAVELLPPGKTSPPTISNGTQGDRASQSIPAGSILKVLTKQAFSQNGTWLQLELCQVSANTSPAIAAPPKGFQGWIRDEQAVDGSIIPANPAQLDPGVCGQ